MATPSSTISETTPASATAGPRKSRTRGAGRWVLSLTAKTALLAVIFALVPVFLYIEFRSAYEESQALLLRSVRDEGRVISQSLLPDLETADLKSLPELGHVLARFSGEVSTIKLLFAPAAGGAGSDGFYYVASWPTVEPSSLQMERDALERQGVLTRLAHDCRGEMPFSLIYHRVNGGAEIITAVTPLSTTAGCWAVVSTFSADAFPTAHLGEPYWETPTVQIAAAIYLAMAVITFSTLLSLRSALRRFARRARRIRKKGPDAGSFAGREGLPELADVAAEFDSMVDALHRSAAEIRLAAEDNAHAFKTPIAVIRQSLEPLRRSLPPANRRALRAIGLVESSLDRLDGLVASARRLDEATADPIGKPLVPVDLERILGRLIQTRVALSPGHEVAVHGQLPPGIFVLGNEEMIEMVVENLIDNAVSFSPQGGDIAVGLGREAGFAVVTIADTGPGVSPDRLERIFDRYYSERHADGTSDTASTYFGIGLWIARRYVEAMGGTITAENRSPHGLSVRVSLPLAPGRA